MADVFPPKKEASEGLRDARLELGGMSGVFIHGSVCIRVCGEAKVSPVEGTEGVQRPPPAKPG